MKTLFINIDNSILFKEIKDKLDPKSYVECGGCGAIKHDESWSLARIMNEKLNADWYDEGDLTNSYIFNSDKKLPITI